jgi:hypothetical protein
MRGRVSGGLARFWTTGSAVLLLVIAAHVLTQPGFPLGLGVIRTTGPAGLWLTLAPAVAGLLGVALLRRPGRLGPELVLLYSGFWSLVVVGALPGVWNAKRAFCLSGLGFCIASQWIGRMAAIGVLSSFLLVAFWAWRRLVERGPATEPRA